jgi:hypothetical protein
MTNEMRTDAPDEDGTEIILTPEEDGIRVKGGSVTLETVSPDGFELDITDPHEHKFKTVKETKDGYRIAVNHGSCRPDFYADNVVTVELTIENPAGTTRTVVLGDAPSGLVVASKKLSLPAAGFTLLADLSITTTDTTERLAVIKAFGPAPDHKLLLRATPSSPTVPMEAYLAVRK